jgi:hypothetical protein
MMFCPSDLPVAKYKAQQLQEKMLKAVGDEQMSQYVVSVRAGHNVAHEEDLEGNIIRPRPDQGYEACYKVIFHRQTDDLHAEEFWRPDFVDACIHKQGEVDKAVRRFTDAFDKVAAEESTKH